MHFNVINMQDSSYTSKMHEKHLSAIWFGGGGGEGTAEVYCARGGGSAKAYALQQGGGGVKNGRFMRTYFMDAPLQGNAILHLAR